MDGTGSALTAWTGMAAMEWVVAMLTIPSYSVTVTWQTGG